MKLISSYNIQFKDGYNAVRSTIRKYNDAVRYLLLPVQEHWAEIQPIHPATDRMKYVEHLVHHYVTQETPSYQTI